MKTPLRHWFVTAQCGDFRLESAGDEASTLTVEDPTEEDLTKLLPFLADMRERSLIVLPGGIMARAARLVGLGGEPGIIAPKGITTIRLAAPWAALGPQLAGAAYTEGNVWTALRCEGGVIKLTETAKPAVTPAVEAAATLQPPRRGCPAPSPADRRAAQVLSVFSTARQWAQYQAEGRMLVIGNATGRAYYAHHRGEAHARGLSRSLIEASTGRPVCVWDDSVPADEEVLGLKLGVEHRERWLLDRSTIGGSAYGRTPHGFQ